MTRFCVDHFGTLTSVYFGYSPAGTRPPTFGRSQARTWCQRADPPPLPRAGTGIGYSIAVFVILFMFYVYTRPERTAPMTAPSAAQLQATVAQSTERVHRHDTSNPVDIHRWRGPWFRFRLGPAIGAGPRMFGSHPTHLVACALAIWLRVVQSSISWSWGVVWRHAMHHQPVPVYTKKDGQP